MDLSRERRSLSLRLGVEGHPHCQRRGITAPTQAQTLFRFTKCAPKTEASLSPQFLANLLLLCLKSIKAACFGHF